MPLKLGNGGNGLEEYNEHDGKYQEDFIKKEFEKNNLKYSSEKEQKRLFDEEKEKKIENIQKQQEELIKKFRTLSRGLTKEQQLQNKELLDLDSQYKILIQQKTELQNKEFEPIIPSNQETILLVDSLEKVQKIFENISDVVSSMREGSPLTDKGHPKSYWKLSTNTNSEFFANCFQSLISNNKEEIELYEKFFPKSFKVSKEILQ